MLLTTIDISGAVDPFVTPSDLIAEWLIARSALQARYSRHPTGKHGPEGGNALDSWERHLEEKYPKLPHSRSLTLRQS